MLLTFKNKYNISYVQLNKKNTKEMIGGVYIDISLLYVWVKFLREMKVFERHVAKKSSLVVYLGFMAYQPLLVI